MSRFASLLLFSISGALSWYVYYLGAVWFGSSVPVFMASIMIASMAIHELGHWVAMEKYGVRAHIFFAVIIGGAVPEDVKKLNKLSWRKTAIIVLAGPAGNVATVALAYCGQLMGYLSNDQLSRIANMNAALIVFNLVPIGRLDGGRLVKLLFDSLPEHLDSSYAKAIIGSVYAFSLLVSAFTGEFYLLPAGMVLWGTLKLSNIDDPHGSNDSRAMSRSQVNTTILAYLSLLFIGIVWMSTTTPWPV